MATWGGEAVATAGAASKPATSDRSTHTSCKPPTARMMTPRASVRAAGERRLLTGDGRHHQALASAAGAGAGGRLQQLVCTEVFTARPIVGQESSRRSDGARNSIFWRFARQRETSITTTIKKCGAQDYGPLCETNTRLLMVEATRTTPDFSRTAKRSSQAGM